MVDPPVLVLRGFGVAIGGRPVLADLKLELPRTGLTVLVGPGGSGKSTLLRTLAGLNDAHPSLKIWGDAELDGRPLFAPRANEGVAGNPGRISLVIQHSRFFMNTVRENLVSKLPYRSHLDRASQTELALRLLRQSGLAALSEQLGAEVVTLSQSVQRQLAIVRAIAPDPLVLLADEPTSGLDDDAAVDVIALLRAQAASRAVLFVTHNQRHARAAGGETLLLAGGTIVESSPTSRFFREPKTEPGRRFVATGGCALPSPGASEADLAEDSPRPAPLPIGAREASLKAENGPRGFFWVKSGRLGGLPRPGIIIDLEQDLDALTKLGVTLLVTLEETRTVDVAKLAERGIGSIHFPIPDMGAPDLGPTRELCARVNASIASGAVVAFHCLAGLGRTGTLLASQLIWDGDSAVRAIDQVRQINARCIQSDEQVQFLRVFERAVRPHLSSAPPSP